MKHIQHYKKLVLILIIPIFLYSCSGVDARQFPPDPKERVKKNMEEGRGFRLMDGADKKNTGTFDFASSNELWRASLDTIDFIPLASANYSGGIIISDWYSDNFNDESIKISIRFLTNEVRSDALDIKIFYKKCNENENCKVSEKSGELVTELKKKILSKAAIYKKERKDKNFKPYKMPKADE
ncbi:DUF3576 domain-containing protein [Candidatus Pelagibacter sp.]|nr:DUF3576 domain-containing protein [Candidatus Pelagibacter sp.]